MSKCNTRNKLRVRELVARRNHAYAQRSELRFRSDATRYVTRKVTKAPCANVDVVAPLKVRAFAIDTLDVNQWHANRDEMIAISDRRWNERPMA